MVGVLCGILHIGLFAEGCGGGVYKAIGLLI